MNFPTIQVFYSKSFKHFNKSEQTQNWKKREGHFEDWTFFQLKYSS